MAVSKLSTNKLSSKTIYSSMLAGNPKYVPSAFNFIASTTVSTPVSSIVFSSIPSTYKHLQIRGICRNTANVGGDAPGMRFNSDSASNYSHHTVNSNGTSISLFNSGSDTIAMFGYNTADASYSSNIFTSTVIEILDYANTNKYKTLFTRYGSDNNGTPRNTGLTTANWRSTSAITSISLAPYPNSTNTWVSGTTFALYGME
jgi:hypothetical protein